MTSHSVLKPQPRRPEILAIDPYVPGKSRVPGVAKVHKLSSNELPLGPSPKAIEAVRALAAVSSSIPTGRRRRCARRSAGVTGSTRRESSAATAPTSCWPFWRMSFCTRATRGSTANTAF